MKKKKQTRKIKQWLVAALGLTLLGTGLWAGMNGEKLQAKPKSDINFSPKGVEDTEPWLPYYKPGLGIGNGGWLDSVTSYIPRSNAFVMQYLPGKTKLVDKSEGVLVGTHPTTGGNPAQEWAIKTDQPQYVKYENVGYYDGDMLTVKMTITPNKPSGQDELLRSYIYFEGPYFLSNAVDSKCEGASLSFEFYNSAGKEVTVQSYLPLIEQWNRWTTQVSTQEIQNIYSVSRQYNYQEKSAPVLIQYKENKQTNFLEFLGTVDAPINTGVEPIQQSLTMTVNKFPVIKYDVTELGKMRSAVGFGLVNQSEVKVEIPDPQATTQTYTEIIGEDKGITGDQMIDSLDYGFIQQMPWESQAPKDNRTQIPTWTLGAPAGNATVVPSDKWKVQSQDDPTLGDGDVYNWFTAEDNTLTPTGGLTGKLAEDEFYNHYYKFNRSLNIDYSNPIARTLLKVKDGLDGYYFDYSGKVDLAVDDTNPTPEQEAGMNKNRKEVNYDTAINFYAPLDYKYGYLKDGKFVEFTDLDATTYPTTGDGIVTWNAPVQPVKYADYNDDGTVPAAKAKSPASKGKYQFKEARLNDPTSTDTSLQVKVTKRLKTGGDANKAKDYTQNNTVYLIYEEDEPWLPYYKPGLGIGGGGWLDTMESYIPRRNAFVMQYMPGKTKVVGWSESIAPKDTPVKDLPKATSKDGVSYADTIRIPNQDLSTDNWVHISNIGFFNGKNIGVKVHIKVNRIPNAALADTTGLWIDPEYFLHVVTLAGSGGITAEYEFVDERGESLNEKDFSYNWTNNTIVVNANYKIGDAFSNIYSVSRAYAHPIGIQFAQAGGYIDLLGKINASGGSYEMIQAEATVTYDNKNIMRVGTFLTDDVPTDSKSGTWLRYSTQSQVKVEIPDPQATTQTYTEIIDADKGITENQMIDSLDYGFIQQMPWESVSPLNNRTQIPTWTLDAPAGNATVVPSDKWKVQSQDDPTLGGGDVYDWFTATDNSLTPTGGLTGKLAEDEFYNHYYKFNRSLKIDYNNPIARTSLKAKDGRYYFDYSGKVDLAVDDTNPTPEQEAGMNKNREEVNYDTAINFLAPLEYKYVNSVTGEEIPAGSLPTSGDGIVTWDAPLTPQQLTDGTYTEATGQGVAPAITGYSFDRSELNGSETDTQIKVTKLLRSEAPAGRQTGNLLPSLMADYGLDLNESKNEGEKPISFNQFVQPESLTQILRAVDATDPANYDQNNVVTLYYTPVSYDVEIEVTKPNGDTLKANANSSFEVSNDNGETWVAVSGYDFAAGNTYKIRQNEAVNPYYDIAGESPVFTVAVDAEGDFTLTATDGDGYSFIRTELVDKKLKIKVINQPSGGIVLSQVEPLDYGTVQMPRKDMTINRVDPDWKIDFEDNRPPEDGNNLHLYVTLTKEFTDNNGEGTKKLAGILAFINEPGAITNNDLLVKDTQMPIKMIDAPKYGKDSVTWAKDAGFLLQLDRETEAKLHVGKDQNYQAELTFTLAEDPLP